MKHFIIALLSLVATADASGPIPVRRSGLAGIDGFTFYDPFCAHGCFRSFSPFPLSCSTTISAGGHTTADDAAHNLALCRSSDFPYLSSIAWCIHLYCPEDVPASKIETFWETQITGDVKILPQWSYGEVMANITQPPTEVVMNMSMVLNKTMLTTYDDWDTTQATLVYFFRETVLESYYGLSICLTAFGLPILMTCLGYLPFMTEVLERIKPRLYPSIIGSYHDVPLPFLLGNVPTIGQGLFIATLVTLNIVFLAVGYKTLYPDHVFQWYTNRYQELMAYFMWRTGVLAFCQMPVLFLFSSRNNILFWLTNWTQSTYKLLHRWIARLFLFQTLLHSTLALVLYQNTGSYTTSLKIKWWIWGCVATVAAVVIVLTSALIIRQRAYELFLITHIVMAVICIVGCWYHVYIGSTIVRVDIPGIRWAASGHYVYAYFPTLTSLKPWENHPFSLIPTAELTGWKYHEPANTEAINMKNDKVTMSSGAVANGGARTTSGVTLFVRKSAGMTRALKAQEGLLTLLEGPYATNPTRAVLQSDRLLLVGGGIGITGLLGFVSRHPNVKVLYSVKAKDECLVESLGAILKDVREKEISVGRRLDTQALLRDEADLGWSKIAVVVCGPAGMCDDTRAVVAQLGKEKSGTCSFELEVDAFSW
ncbi:ferric reductase transmembrane component 4 [Colletotrichum plurivorum]|uniref:Ferric reductase transmembrane component 4 n=1 Tax=Colletotrichum plurivorum TaxID=2175906 RepID=A0A8H6NI41_9PEZI|nr:ferric reductase transmembrane component 4 [Colletotrichum plurivorum]